MIRCLHRAGHGALAFGLVATLVTTVRPPLAAAGDACHPGEFPVTDMFVSWGSSVAMDASGTVALVGGPGAFFGDGLVRAFEHVDGVWESVELLAPGFGSIGSVLAMSDDGSAAAIGAPFESEGFSFGAGAVYVLERDPADGSWSTSVRVVQPPTVAHAHFGTSVDVSADGSTIAIGQIGDDFFGSTADTAWIVTRDGDGWTDPVELVRPVADDAEQFGADVTLDADGTQCIVGAPGPLQTNQCSIHAFELDDGSWTHLQRLPYVPANGLNYFGARVEFAGDQVLVGDPFNDEDEPGEDQTNAGCVFVLERIDGAWTPVQAVFAPPVESFDGISAPDLASFGGAIAVRGDRALVGAPTDAANRGSAYLLRRDAGHWSVATRIVTPDVAFGASASFGAAVDLVESEEELLIGAPDATVDGVKDSGRAYFTSPVIEPAVVAPDPSQSQFSLDFFNLAGRLVSLDLAVFGTILFDGFGDCDGDGVPETLVLTELDLGVTDELVTIPIMPGLDANYSDIRVTLAQPGACVLVDAFSNEGVVSDLVVRFDATLRLNAGPPMPVDWNVAVPLLGIDLVPDGRGRASMTVPGQAGEIVLDLGLGEDNPTANWDGSMVAPPIVTTDCPGDVDGSGTVDTADLLALLSSWGACDAPCPPDLDGDGAVALPDLLVLLAAWGPCPN